MPTATANDIIIATAKYLTAALIKINKNPLLPPSYTITRKALLQPDSILFNASSELKPQKSPTFKLPRVFTPKPVAAPPRVSPSTAQDFDNISPTTQKHRRDIRAAKSKAYPKLSPLSSPSPKFKSNPHHNTSSLDNTNDALTTINLPDKLQYLVQQEINRASNPSINPLLKLNTLLDTTTRKIIEYKKLMKVSDGKIGSMVAQNNLLDLHKDEKKIIPKEPTHYFLFILINYQRTRNQPIFASAKKFDHKNNILIVYDPLLAEI